MADYKSGEFYKRELPCILTLLDEHQLTPEVIILDGYVWLDGVSKPALGYHLQQAIDFTPALIGVARNATAHWVIILMYYAVAVKSHYMLQRWA